jgi:hypothetical protein
MTEATEGAAGAAKDAADEIVEIVFDSGNWPIIAFLALVIGFGAAWALFYYIGVKREDIDDAG